MQQRKTLINFTIRFTYHSLKQLSCYAYGARAHRVEYSSIFFFFTSASSWVEERSLGVTITISVKMSHIKRG